MTRIAPGAVVAALAAAAALVPSLSSAQTRYEAEVRRTAFGIAHVKANDYAGIGYGVGYAFAQDNFCMIADEFVTVRGAPPGRRTPPATPPTSSPRPGGAAPATSGPRRPRPTA